MAKVNAVKGGKGSNAGKGKGRAAAGTPADVLLALGTPSASKLLKWLGSNGYTRKQATAITLHLLPTTSGSTIGCQFYSGRALAAGNTPTHAGKAAEFDKGQVAAIAALAKQLGV
jgi:hypothetical protein